MAALALIAVGILSLVLFAFAHSALELFRDIRQIRDALGILDRPIDIEIGSARDASPADFGLPSELNDAQTAFVLFLSPKCSTCRVLAENIGGALPSGR